MMLIEHDGARPQIDPSAHVAPNAVVCGDVAIGANTTIGFGAVLTAESGPIRIGAHCVVMEQAVLRGTGREPLSLGDHCLVGPHAHLSGCKVGDNVFIATGAALFNGAVLGDRATVRINAVVHIGTRLEADASVPIGWVAIGDPAHILPPDAGDEILQLLAGLDFRNTVFGTPPPGAGGSAMPEITRRYTALLQRHRDDRVLG